MFPEGATSWIYGGCALLPLLVRRHSSPGMSPFGNSLCRILRRRGHGNSQLSELSPSSKIPAPDRFEKGKSDAGATLEFLGPTISFKEDDSDVIAGSSMS